MTAKIPKTPEALYLDLLKDTLSFTLWEEPGWPVETFNHLRPAYKRIPLGLLSRFLGILNYQAIKKVNVTREQKENGDIWPALADTMVGHKRLNNLQMCIESVIKARVPGDLIETGVWRGGACIFMRAVLAAHGVTDRRVFVADSFEGLPLPDEKKYPADTEGDPSSFVAISRRFQGAG